MKIIKSIKSTLTRINPYGEVVSQYLLTESIHNENGHVTCSLLFDEDGEIENKSLFELGDDGKILSQIHYERSNDLIERTEFFDTDDDVQYKTEITTKDGAKTVHEYHYNQIGNTDQITIKNEDGSIEAYEFFKFNEKRQVTEEIRVDRDHKPQFRKSLFYNEADQIIKEHYFDYMNRLQREITFHYNQRNLIEEKIDKNFGIGSVTKNKYTYDLSGNQLLDETFENDLLSFKNFCAYDEWNNLVEERIMQTGPQNYIEIIHHEIEYR